MPPLTTVIPALAAFVFLGPAPPLILNPVGFSAHFITIETPQAAFYVRQLGIRNFVIGLALASLTYQGQISAVATVMKCILPLGFLDAWSGWMYRGKFVGNDLTHVVVGCAVAGAGVWVERNL